jgi:methyl-accepting chemotaxis protein
MRSSTFRWTLFVSGAFGVCILLLFGFIYWQTAAYMTARVDRTITEAASAVAAEPPEARLEAVGARLKQDPRRVRLAALFGADGRRIAGNVESRPPGLEVGAGVHSVVVVRVDSHGRENQTARAIALNLPNDEILMIGRNVDELAELANIVEEALALGLLPALCLAVATGALLSLRAKKRVEEVNRQVERIVGGDLRQRLPTEGLNDPFDKLALIVNGMLNEIEALIHKIAGVGDDIAHDLRTPLTRVRVQLERGRENAQTLEQLRAVADQAITGLVNQLGMEKFLVNSMRSAAISR